MGNFQLEKLLTKMYTNSNEAIFFFNEFSEIIEMNDAAESILDIEIINDLVNGEKDAFCSACQGYTSEKEIQTCSACYLANPGGDFSSFQVYIQTRGKGTVPYTASFQTIDWENKIRVLMLRDVSRKFKTMKMLNETTMIKKIIKAQEDERKRISRELHDSVAQEMLSALVDMRVLKYMDINEEVLKKVEQTEGSLMRLLDDIRHLSVELRPAILDDLGIEAAFRTHFKYIKENYGLEVEFSAELASKRYEGEIETVVYRICQEAVFNALKYANIDSVVVKLYEDNHFLHLRVVDEGVGFEPNYKNSQGTGLGLYGMKERADLVQGKLSIQSQIGNGTNIHLKIPLSEGVEKGM